MNENQIDLRLFLENANKTFLLKLTIHVKLIS